MKASIAEKETSNGIRGRKRDATARLDARISRKLKDKIEHAAHLRDQSVTDFLTVALDEAASRVIKEDAALQLHIDDQRHLAEVLLSGEPFPPISAMSRLRRYARDYARTVERK